ncbi:DUF262 domain-containing protein [Arcobacter arenosus]|uniref:DUF262 domain-containing protein n=1 Tax=Arcobacter arenosus TaxID=2576037 RepID=A0A5R8XZ38_9BACT|nr:DUF262 domain-containing protein [Arcobacter arenosus]TLP36938.1 DUF262 domain-containing protein [Arcobacter arenosus]
MKTDLFSANLVTLRTMFTNEYDPKDRAKTFYIPLYQRDYNWPIKNILKLFDDIYTLIEDNIGYEAYFLGGFVLSRESMEGENRTSMSLEIIDGQQRLMTLSLMISCIVQSLKYEKRKYDGKQDYVDNLVNELTNYLITKRFDDNFKVSKVLKIERSDKLKNIYENIVINLINERIIYSKYNEIKKMNDENRVFINNIQKLHRMFKSLSNDELLHFTIQLLDHTQVVITKTDSFETGYLVFEKLNDSGKLLNADDLLKNFLFQVTTQDENDQLKEKWNYFIKTIEEVTPKISPKLFLEYYLISIGYDYSSTSTGDIFKAYRKYFEENSNIELETLNKMIESIEIFKQLKESDYCEKTLNQIDFKLGYIPLLSFYNKNKEMFFDNYREILNYIFRFGYVFLLTEKIKPIKKIVTSICKKIHKKEHNFDLVFNEFKEEIDSLILAEKDIFSNQLLNNDRYRKEHFSKILFQMINIHSNYEMFNNDYTIERIMPIDYEEMNYKFEEIDNDILPKYANLIGNLAMYDFNKSISTKDFEKRLYEISIIDNVFINNLLNKNNKDIDLSNNLYQKELTNYNNSTWGKEVINKRTEVLTKIATELFINKKINIDNLYPKENESIQQ